MSSPPVASEGGELAQFIRQLSNPELAKRESAAEAIFRHGYELARTAISAWLLNPQLASFFVLSQSGTPKTTVGLAVERGTFESVWAANGSPQLANVPDDQDAEEFELDFPRGVRFDILTAKHAGSGGAIERFVQKFGESIQQVELEVRDVDEATEILDTQFGLPPIYPKTRAGADGTRVNFFLVPAKGKKVLIELVETSGGFASNDMR